MADNNVSDLQGHRHHLSAQINRLSDQVEALKGGAGGGTLPPMEILDAKIAAAEARVDTKFAALRGDLAAFATKGTVWGATATALGLVLAVGALASDRFDAGLSVRDAVGQMLDTQRNRDAVQDRKLDEILRRLPSAPASPRARTAS